MLGTLIVFSGCFGTGTTNGEDDDDVGTTVINNYYNNTTNVIESTPEIFTSTTNGTPATGIASVNISQSAGEAIHMLGVTGTISGDGTPSYDDWDRYFRVESDCGDVHFLLGQIDSYAAGTDHWLGGSGLDCTHEVTTMGGTTAGADYRVITVVYERVPVTVE